MSARAAVLASAAVAVLSAVLPHLCRGHPQSIDFTTASRCHLADLTLGVCVARENCTAHANEDNDRNRCPGRVCCETDNILLRAAFQTTVKPSADGADAEPVQLVESCGRPQPSNVLLKFFGRTSQQIADRFLTGGYNAVVGKWPWIALLGERQLGGSGGDEPHWLCGGSLITTKTVLTAAHCVTNRKPAELVVRLSEYDLGTEADNDDRFMALSIARIVIHAKYVRGQNDIAVMVLAAKVPFTQHVRPICLPPPAADHTGQLADLAGWGRQSFGGAVSPILQEARLLVKDVTQCEASYRRLPDYNFSYPGGFMDTKICASGANGESKDACQGDSGGPLVVNGTDGAFQIIGVVSSGAGCGHPDYPGIYTKVSMFIQWLVQHSE